jgi:hypothetical protein
MMQEARRWQRQAIPSACAHTIVVDLQGLHAD